MTRGKGISRPGLQTAFLELNSLCGSYNEGDAPRVKTDVFTTQRAVTGIMWAAAGLEAANIT